MPRQLKMPNFLKCFLRNLSGNCQQSFSRRDRLLINQVENDTLRLTHDAAMGLGHEIAHRHGMPVVSPRHARSLVHSLLHHGPLAVGRHYERVQVDLESVSNAVVVDLRREPAGPNEIVAIQSPSVCNCN